MIIGCSECGTRYVVGPQAIGKHGRRVKCSKCNNVWFQEPAPEDHEILPSEAAEETTSKPEPALKDEKGTKEPQADDNKSKTEKEEDTLGVFGGDVRKNVPVVVRKRDYRVIIGWVALVLFLVGVIGGLTYFRKDIERRSDFAEIIYQKWDALVLKERKQPTETEQNPAIKPPLHPSTFLSMRQSAEVRLQEENPSLYITTEIRNSSDGDIELPEMQGFIRDAAGQEIFKWSQPINPSIVPANGILQFEIIVDNIPAGSAEAELVFNWPEEPAN